MNAVIRYAVEMMSIKEIGTSYAIENATSGRVLQKPGFKFEKEIVYED